MSPAASTASSRDRGSTTAPAPITARQLLAWGDLDARRRRAAARAGWLPSALIALAGLGGAAAVAAQARADVAAASRLALLALGVSHLWVMLGTSFRMYWRADAPLWARLPIPGGALFDVALVRTLRATARAAVVAVPCAAALALEAPEVAARHLALWAAVATATALLLPAVALAGGAIVASDKAEALVAAMGGGELRAPPTVWLGGLPGLAAAAVVLLILGTGGWAAGAATSVVGPPAPWLAGLAGAGVVGVVLARRAAPAVMPQAVREVSALDVQRLAHLEIHRPTALERAIGGRLAPGGALVHAKDARLMRRRFPMAMVTGAATTIALWIVAASGPAAAAPWVGVLVAGFVAYGVAMARRMTSRPIELPFVRTLPIAPAHVRAAKRAYVATWAVLYPALGAGPVIATAPDPVACAAILVGGIAASLALAFAIVRDP